MSDIEWKHRTDRYGAVTEVHKTGFVIESEKEHKTIWILIDDVSPVERDLIQIGERVRYTFGRTISRGGQVSSVQMVTFSRLLAQENGTDENK